jgi:hypothetical protein
LTNEKGFELHTVEIVGKIVPVPHSPETTTTLMVLPWDALGRQSWRPPKLKWDAAKALPNGREYDR